VAAAEGVETDKPGNDVWQQRMEGMGWKQVKQEMVAWLALKGVQQQRSSKAGACRL